MTDLSEQKRPLLPGQAYDARQPLLVFDGVCVFCSGFVQIVLKIDRNKRFRLATAQSPLGEALFREHGLPTEDYDSNLAIIDGAAFTKLDSFVAVMAALGWPWRAARLLIVLPRPLRDWLYDRIAKNRYALFGRKDSCEIPSAELRQRLIS
ncbi:thiol-disulfide oxidoreductase DCC family protein [Mesorhizobium sp.]|uniref:thiol-disulfide oxidoreductase DCC family protein n=4 Tax=Mesorhizobium sp. TaxID=1871066 RepID=UPI000FE8399D|nr:thiol-disulfide oxidoreductase DCC family protein [Mesorhizobium sp.]RWI85866.1 MAG: thiol-disulfide oxidoreductase DCC family protein [Mesorhizobium sp.]TIQ03934.1 MAG: thiol-disulfide oxidoreductase DCC family protein [Mesorhizobium sp.]TIR19474.1 MAG: thiol-disulfide oxidoreductase DCC family protein [Mesorhizobium sp.]